MRPRSRLLSKRRLLLPTIREGAEETVRDLNEANALHVDPSVSSEDYLLSICHLAHPTFPSRDVSPYNHNNMSTTQQLDQRFRLSRPSGTTSTTLGFSSAEEAQVVDVYNKEGTGLIGDPLEFLYGHQNNLSGGMTRAFGKGRVSREGRSRSRAHSIPRASSPDLPRQRKSSCPELLTSTSGASVPNTSPQLDSFSGLEAREAEGMERQTPAIKQSLLSQWISECKSAWREARAQACMLPAIAEI